MPFRYSLSFTEQLPPAVREEFEHLAASVQGALQEQFDLTNELAASVGSGTLAEAPTSLGVNDAGFRYRITDYGHEVVWDGSVWQFAPGDDGNGYFQDFAFTPQQEGWALCDGSAITYLVVGGASLTTATITPPSMTGYYRKGAAAYTGTQVAGSVSGQTAEVGESGATADDMDIAANAVDVGGTFDAVIGPGGGGSKFRHKHDAGTLNPDPPHVNVLTYFRR